MFLCTLIMYGFRIIFFNTIRSAVKIHTSLCMISRCTIYSLLSKWSIHVFVIYYRIILNVTGQFQPRCVLLRGKFLEYSSRMVSRKSMWITVTLASYISWSLILSLERPYLHTYSHTFIFSGFTAWGLVVLCWSLWLLPHKVLPNAQGIAWNSWSDVIIRC